MTHATRYIESELITEGNEYPHGSLINCDHYGTLDFTLAETGNTITVQLTNGPLVVPSSDPAPQLTVAPNQPQNIRMRIVFTERIIATDLTRAQVNQFLKKYYAWLNDPNPTEMIFDANSLVKGFKVGSKKAPAKSPLSIVGDDRV